MRTVIGKYLPLPPMPIPVPKPKMEIPPISMTRVSHVFDDMYLQNPIPSVYPLTFEQLKQRNGYILYSTNITVHPSDPAVLQIMGLADRALIFVDSEYSGTLSRTQKSFALPINVRLGSKLDILVENQGRVCFGSQIGELKGITSNVTLGPIVLTHWNQYKVFGDWDHVVKNVEEMYAIKQMDKRFDLADKSAIPSFFAGQFTLPSAQGYPLDTFLRLDDWKKGLAFLNGFNLGRYWAVGPQITLYSPAHLFKPYPQTNTLVVFETEGSPCAPTQKCSVQFVKHHVINATTPYA